MTRSTATSALVMIIALAGAEAFALGLHDGRLTPCPDSPNCVSSDATDPSRRVEALRLTAPPAQAWAALEAVLKATPRVTIVQQSGDYLHAEFASAVFGFVDDVEFQLRPREEVIAVRSASRTGYYDFGANRSRVEELRRKLQERGVVR